MAGSAPRRTPARTAPSGRLTRWGSNRGCSRKNWAPASIFAPRQPQLPVWIMAEIDGRADAQVSRCAEASSPEIYAGVELRYRRNQPGRCEVVDGLRGAHLSLCEAGHPSPRRRSPVHEAPRQAAGSGGRPLFMSRVARVNTASAWVSCFTHRAPRTENTLTDLPGL